MTNLKEGQRIDVVNVNDLSGYCMEMQKTYIAEIGFDEYCDLQFVSTSFSQNLGNVCVTPDGFQKVGTFIVKSLKGGSSA